MPSTDTKYFIHERWDHKDYTEAIQAAHRLLNFTSAGKKGHPGKKGKKR